MLDPALGTPLDRALQAQARASVRLDAAWPAPPAVLAFTTLRRGLAVGVSAPPFDDFNLGAHCGDAPDAVATNRAALGWVGALPSAPCWLRQVHGTRVWRFDAPTAVEIEADAAVSSTPGVTACRIHTWPGFATRLWPAATAGCDCGAASAAGSGSPAMWRRISSSVAPCSCSAFTRSTAARCSAA